VNGSRVRPSRDARLGDLISLTRGDDPMELTIRALSDKRGKAADAQALYEETSRPIPHLSVSCHVRIHAIA
jgi:ribosome-associated heat shock protein Hsp15